MSKGKQHLELVTKKLNMKIAELGETIQEVQRDIDNMNESLPLLSYISMFKNIELVDRALQFFFQMQVMNFYF